MYRFFFISGLYVSGMGIFSGEFNIECTVWPPFNTVAAISDNLINTAIPFWDLIDAKMRERLFGITKGIIKLSYCKTHFQQKYLHFQRRDYFLSSPRLKSNQPFNDIIQLKSVCLIMRISIPCNLIHLFILCLFHLLL